MKSNKSFKVLLPLLLIVSFNIYVDYLRLYPFSGLYVSDGGTIISETKHLFGFINLWYNGSYILYGRQPFLSLIPLGILNMFFNPFQTLAIYAVVGRIFAIVGMYIFLIKYFELETAIVSTFLFSVSFPLNLQMAWGGIFAYVAYGLIFIILSNLEISIDLKHILKLSFLTALLIGFDIIPTVFFTIFIILYTIFNFSSAFFRDDFSTMQHVFKFSFIYILLSMFMALPFLPQYLNMVYLYFNNELKYTSSGTFFYRFIDIKNCFRNYMSPPLFWVIVLLFGSFSLFSKLPIILGSGNREKIHSLRYIYASLLATYFIKQFIILINRPARMIYYLNFISIIPLAILLNISSCFISKISKNFYYIIIYIRLPSRSVSLAIYCQSANLFKKTLVIVFILLIFIYVYMPNQSKLNAALWFYNRGPYGLDSSKLKVLEALKYLIPKHDTIITNVRGHFDFWIQGYLERRAIGVEEPFVYLSEDLTFSDERQRAHVASVALYGNYAIENGFIQLLDTFPISFANPYFSIYTGSYEKKLFIDDKSVIIEYQIDREYKEISLDFATKNFKKSANMLIFTYNVQFSNDTIILIYKTYELIGNKVYLKFNITVLKDSLRVRKVYIPILSLEPSDEFIFINNESFQIEINGLNRFGYHWSATVATIVNNEVTVPVNIYPIILYGCKGVNFIFEQKDNLMNNLTIEFIITFYEEGVAYNEYSYLFRFIDANFWLNYYNVKYAVIDESDFRALYFLKLSNNWEIIQKIDKFLILKRTNVLEKI